MVIVLKVCVSNNGGHVISITEYTFFVLQLKNKIKKISYRESSKTKMKNNDPDVHARPGHSYFYWSRGVNQYFYIPKYFFKHVSVLILTYRMWIFLTPLAISKSTSMVCMGKLVMNTQIQMNLIATVARIILPLTLDNSPAVGWQPAPLVVFYMCVRTY